MPIEQGLLSSVLGRDNSLFREEMQLENQRIGECIGDSSILVIGAAGSIGAAFVYELCCYQPRTLHLVDINENGLAELVRDLRSSGISLPDDFRTYAIDFGSVEFAAMLNVQTHYTHILNFSALKHVRSERDPFTLMRLLQTNVVANARLVDAALEQPKAPRLFSVSSDKAVNPANLMGASKALMERVLLARTHEIEISSARFANVAFSAGSLLAAFMNRIERLQPLAAPNDVRRYFISHEEAGQLCLLSCFTGNNCEIFTPKLQLDKDAMTFSEIALLILDRYGKIPAFCDSAEDALRLAKKLTAKSKEWPCYFSPSDTTGEKSIEEFVGNSELTDEKRYNNIVVVTKPTIAAINDINIALEGINSLYQRGSWSKEELLDIVRVAIPELKHTETNKNLDEKL